MTATSPPQVEPTTKTVVGKPPAGSSRRISLLLAVAAGICWAVVVAMLLIGDIGALPDPIAPARLFFYLLVLLAAALTFAPIERQLGLHGLTSEGMLGMLLLVYTIAFVPAPVGWLLAPPDAPVYLLLAMALLLSVSAIALPIVFVTGQHLFRQRAQRYDVRRARRQAFEIGAFAALLVGMAGLRVLTPIGIALLLLILMTVELLFLSFTAAE
ncbi:MAG TPA: hypothetical protein PKA05_19145 [Roseiflexaceae bacterium]|nr:hypothetical protein [Roseiflexaceae bacterium]HMP42504.1 hypothetical protein [Roseiflexaceae bacterium]